MYYQGKNVYLWRRSLALACCVSVLVTVLVMALVRFSTGREQDQFNTPGSRSTPLAPVPRADLEAVYHQAWLAIRDNYIDEGKLSDWQKWEHKFDCQIRTDKQLAEAIQQMLAALSDKHTLYLPARNLKAFEQAHSGRVVGIGIGLSDSQEIVFVMPNAPADKGGLQKGDRIIAVDGQSIAGISAQELVAIIRGEGQPDTKVVLTVVRNATILRVPLVRGILKIEPAYRGYLDPQKPQQTSIRIDNLRSETVVDELVSGLSDLNKQNVQGLILDLRGLQGGSGQTAAQVAALFLSDGVIGHAVERSNGVISTITYQVKSGKLIVSTMHAGSATIDTTIETPINCFRGIVIVLVDEDTSGAAELIAAALKENQRATLVGMKTAGKGTGQYSIYLNGRHAIRLSTRRYFTPRHALIDSAGVVPDITVATNDRSWMFANAMIELHKRIKPPESAPTSNPGK